MKIFLKLKICIFLIFFTADIFAQSNPVPLDTAIHIERIMTVRNGVIRVAVDPVSHQIFYVLTGGDIYQVIQSGVGPPHDTLMFTTAQHSVQYVQSFAFYDSTLYVSGNNNSDSAMTAGIIVRGKLQPG